MASSRPRRARAPPPAKRRPINRIRVAAGGGRGEGEMAAPPWGRTSRFVRPLRVHPQHPVPWAAHDVHKHAPCTARVSLTKPRVHAPLSGCRSCLGGVVPGVFASLDPRLISVIPTGIAGRDFVTPHDRTLFARHPLARDPPHVIPCGGSPGTPPLPASPPHGKTADGAVLQVDSPLHSLPPPFSAAGRGNRPIPARRTPARTTPAAHVPCRGT